MNYLKNRIIILLCMVLVLVGIIVDYFSVRDVNVSLSPLKANKNTTIFAAYSDDGVISDYVTSYLRRLKEISPNIIYVTDNPISKKEIRKLKPYVNHVIAYKHGEYDWGSYKRGFEFLKKNVAIDKNANSPFVILANDSTIAVKPSFKPILKDMMEKDVDFYGITANKDGTYHIQSYFMVFSPKVYGSDEFSQYLNGVKKQRDGMAVAYTYEVPFTKYFEELGFRHATYIDYESLSYLELNDKHCYPLTMLSKHNLPLLKMRTFTNRLIVKEPRRLVFNWLRKNSHKSYKELLRHLEKIKSPYLEEAR